MTLAGLCHDLLQRAKKASRTLPVAEPCRPAPCSRRANAAARGCSVQWLCAAVVPCPDSTEKRMVSLRTG